MKRITMTLLGLVLAFSTYSQDFSIKSKKTASLPEVPKTVLFDQSPDGTLINFESIVSVVNNTGAGVYATDDFSLSSISNLQSVTAFGFNSDGTFESTVTGINVYIYANSSSNLPAGDPTQQGTGLVELVNVDPSGPAVTITDTGDGGFNITVDIVTANGGSVVLPAGDYWLVVAPTQDIPGFANATRWNWVAAGSGSFGDNVAHLIDPTNAFGGDFTDWTAFSDIGIDDFQSTAFVIEGEVATGFAQAQIVHNAPDPAANVVDVYVNGDLAIDDLEFRTATGYLPLPAGQDLDIDVAPGTSTDVSESLYTTTVNLIENENYIIVADGVIDPTQFDDSVNAIDFNLEIFAGARLESTTEGNTDILAHHGSPDAPTVDIINQNGAGILIDDISYPEFQGYAEIPTDDYLIAVTTSDNSTKVAGYEASLSELGLLNEAITVFASGFLDPSANQNGPEFGLWVSLTSGGPLVELISDEAFVEPYCGPLEFTSGVEPISNVEFAGIANTSDPAVGASPAHENFLDISGDVIAGESYDIALEGNTDGGFTNRFAVFIDWNQNEVLDDAGEVYEITQTINNSNGQDGQQAVQTLDVPIDALAGQTRMRVKKIFGTSGYLDPCVGTGFGQAEEYTINVTQPIARTQVVHNSPDPAAEVVDVYLNGDLLLDDFAFRTATPFVDVPANQQITLSVALGTSTDVSEALYSVDVTLDSEESYIVVADGVLDPSQFDDSVNAIDFNLEVFAGAREAAASAGNTDVLVHHGSPDAPTVDVVNQADGGVLVDDISYPEFQGYLELPTANYFLDITTADNSTVVESYVALLANLGLNDAAITVFASGFLDPSANQDGPVFGLWVSLATGGPLVELPTQDSDPGFPGFYCGPLDFPIGVEPITNVEFSDIANRSDATVDGSPAHEDFTNVIANVDAGESYEIRLEGNTGGNFTNRFVVFIDWNQDFAFDGPNEVYQIIQTIEGSNGEDGIQAIQTLDVPAEALAGETRMRVKKIFGEIDYLDPCAGTAFGQAEDYTVNVETLSNNDFTALEFSFYPNPVEDILTITTNSTVETIKVYNMLGQMVKETSPQSANPQINVSEFNSGVYLVSMEVEGRIETFRIMKE